MPCGNIALFVHFRIPLAAFTPAIAVEILLLGAWFYLSVGAPVKTGHTDSFERIMRADPERFELIWQRDRIKIYRIGQT